MKHYVFFGAQERRVWMANMRWYFLWMYSVTIYPYHLSNTLKCKDTDVGCFTTILNLRSADTFLQGVKATFHIKNFRGKRGDNAEKDKNINLFLETGKSAVEF